MGAVFFYEAKRFGLYLYWNFQLFVLFQSFYRYIYETGYFYNFLFYGDGRGRFFDIYGCKEVAFDKISIEKRLNVIFRNFREFLNFFRIQYRFLGISFESGFFSVLVQISVFLGSSFGGSSWVVLGREGRYNLRLLRVVFLKFRVIQGLVLFETVELWLKFMQELGMGEIGQIF